MEPTTFCAVSSADIAVPSPDDGTWIDDLPDGVLVCNLDGIITSVNLRLARMARRERAELVGESVDMLVPGSNRTRHPQLRAQFISAGATRPMGPGVHLTMLCGDGTELPVEISLSPLPAQRGVVAIVRDVSERLRAEAMLRTTSDLLTLADERERIARDLHDTVLQRLFGLGLELEATAIRAPVELATRIEKSVDEIDRIIRELRTAVFTLGSAQREGSLGNELTALTAQAKRVLGFTPRLRIDGPVETEITPAIRVDLLASMREALTNIARHASASEAEVELHADNRLTMRVLDNGRGIGDVTGAIAGNGLLNMATRARMLGGDCTVANRARGGTELVWWVPLSTETVP